MPQVDNMIVSDDSSIFLENSFELPELDKWVDECIRSRTRFTLSEREVLQSLWDSGEDIRLREDSRFCEVTLSNQIQEGQWRLSSQTITNQYLYELLEDEEWDGYDLYQYLKQLDQKMSNGSFHVFCAIDHRFILSSNDQGVYNVSLRLDRKKITLTPEQKNCIDQLAPQLLALFPDDSRIPWSTSLLLERLKELVFPSGILGEVLPAALENWLLQREEWMRVGRDTWFPKKLVPSLARSHRYAVLPVSSHENSNALSLVKIEGGALLSETQEVVQVVDGTEKVQGQLTRRSSVKWRTVLRTLHLNEGYLPVPTRARGCYPQAKKLSSVVAIPGVWFADASQMTVWLDTENHRLYGFDLQDQCAFLVAGTVLETLWTTSGITFNAIGVDTAIAEEEARLVDLTELAHLRSATLESYRASLRAIMGPSNRGWNFLELYNEVCERQQHKPNKSTIRTILSSSPEFVFVKSQHKWVLNNNILSEIGAKALRKATLLAQDISMGSEAPSIRKMITDSRQRLAHLRSMYLSNTCGEPR